MRRFATPHPLYADWVRVKGLVVSVYEKSIIYSIPAGYFRRKVRIPLSVLKMTPRVDDHDLLVKGWFAGRESLPELKHDPKAIPPQITC